MTHIQIPDVSPRIQYDGDDSTVAFAFGFPIFTDADLEVYIDTTLQSTGYTITGAGQTAGGTVTFTTAPTSDETVTLVRNVAGARTTDFAAAGTMRADDINTALDYAIAYTQDVQDDVNRSIRLDASDAAADMVLPAAASVAAPRRPCANMLE